MPDTKADRKRPSTLRSDALASGAQAKESVFKENWMELTIESLRRVWIRASCHITIQNLDQTILVIIFHQSLCGCMGEKSPFLQQQQLQSQLGLPSIHLESRKHFLGDVLEGIGKWLCRGWHEGKHYGAQSASQLAQVFPQCAVSLLLSFCVIILRMTVKKNSNSGSILRQWVELIRKFCIDLLMIVGVRIGFLTSV